MARTSIELLSVSGDRLNLTGEAHRTSIWRGENGFATISVETKSFTGRIHIEGAIVLSPDERDWFSLHTLDLKAHSGSTGFNLTGNHLWVRARVERDGRVAPQDVERLFGTVEKILMIG